MIQDDKGQFGGLLVTHMPERIPKFLNDFTTRLQALYGKDMGYDNSDREDYDFVAVHLHWYNRFAESVSLFYHNHLRCIVTPYTGYRSSRGCASRPTTCRACWGC